jgi:hypothetical protein
MASELGVWSNATRGELAEASFASEMRDRTLLGRPRDQGWTCSTTGRRCSRSSGPRRTCTLGPTARWRAGSGCGFTGRARTESNRHVE